MYVLVFIPFTVIDHHKSFFMVEVGLLSTDDVDSYMWLLVHFPRARRNKHPLLVLTNQDLALKEVVEIMFSHSKNRLYM